MLLLLLILTVLQIFLVPGLICVGRLRTLHYIDRVILAIPVSFFINYLMVLILVLAGMYTNIAIISIFVAEMLVLAFYMRRAVNQDFACFDKKKNRPVFIKDVFLLINKILTLKGGVFLIASGLLVYLGVFSAWYGEASDLNGIFSWWFSQFGTVIEDWDGVVSWHRWAMHWYNGEFPVGYWTYPQVIPILYSLSYKFIDSPEIYFIPKLIPVLIAFIIPVTAMRLAYVLRKFAFVEILIAIPIFYFLVSRTVYTNYVFSGGADIVMAYFGIICAYCIALSMQVYAKGKVTEYFEVMFWLSTITASAFVVKQMGVFVLAFFILGWLWYSKYLPISKSNRFKIFIGISAIAVLMTVHWYLYVFYNAKNISNDVSIYEAVLKTDWYTRPYEGLKLLHTQLGWWPLYFIALGLLIKSNRVLILPVMSVYIFWAYTVSYDTRNLYVILPLLSYLIAAGIIGSIYIVFNNMFIRTYAYVPLNIKNLFSVKIKGFQKSCCSFLYSLPLANKVSLVLDLNVSNFIQNLFCTGLSKTSRALIITMLFVTPIMIFNNDISNLDYAWAKNKSLNEQLKIGGVWRMNHYLYDEFRIKHTGTGVKIATDYQMMFYIPGLEEFYYDVHTLDYNYFSKAFLNKKTKFILTANTAAKEIAEYMEDGVKLGKFKLLLLAHDYRLFEILEPENNCQEYLMLNPKSTLGKCEY
jgi:hypothetical protein